MARMVNDHYCRGWEESGETPTLSSIVAAGLHGTGSGTLSDDVEIIGQAMALRVEDSAGGF